MLFSDRIPPMTHTQIIAAKATSANMRSMRLGDFCGVSG